jgi:hypothetical protein
VHFLFLDCSKARSATPLQSSRFTQDYKFSIDYSSDWVAKEDELQTHQLVIFHPDAKEYVVVFQNAVVGL